MRNLSMGGLVICLVMASAGTLPIPHVHSLLVRGCMPLRNAVPCELGGDPAFGCSEGRIGGPGGAMMRLKGGGLVALREIEVKKEPLLSAGKEGKGKGKGGGAEAQGKKKGKGKKTEREALQEVVDEMIDSVIDNEAMLDVPEQGEADEKDPEEQGKGWLVDSSSVEDKENEQGSDAHDVTEADEADEDAPTPAKRHVGRGKKDSGGKRVRTEEEEGEEEEQEEEQEEGDSSSVHDKTLEQEDGAINPMSIFREISGEVNHFYDLPGPNAGDDWEGQWASDYHLYYMRPNMTLFGIQQMVPFDESATFHTVERVSGERYNHQVYNASVFSDDIEVFDEGRRFWRRNQTGDLITDHMIACWNDGLNILPRAILLNISRTNWTGAPGWRHDMVQEGNEGKEPVWSYSPATQCTVTWGERKEKGVSRWVVHIDQRQGSFYIGCMTGEPLPSRDVSAKKLRSPAWFIDEEGFAYTTSENGTEDADDDVCAQTGLDRWPPYFSEGSLIWMALDRDRRTLQITVNNGAPFAFYDVDPSSVPFINVEMHEDGATLLDLKTALHRTAPNLRNDVCARWSVRWAEVRRTPISKKGKASTSDCSFWPGGRVQLCGDDIEAEKKRVREWRLSDRQNAELDEYEGFLFEGTEDP